MPEENRQTVSAEEEDWESFLASVDSQYGLETSQEDIPPKKVSHAAPPVKKKKKRGGGLLILVVLLAVLAAAGYFALPYLTAAPQSRIPEGVSVAGVNIGGMSAKAARKTIQDSVVSGLQKQEMVVTLGSDTLRLAPEASGIGLDLDRILETAAFAGGEISIAPYLTVNEAAIRGALQEYADQLSGIYAPASFRTEGEIPALDEDHFDENIPCPALILNAGSAGATMDVDALYFQILDAYASGKYSVDAQVTKKDPEPLDWDAIAAQIAVHAKNAAIDPQTKALTPGSYGIGFDADNAKALIAKAAAGEDIRIPLEYVKPEVLGQEAYFQDVLGFCQTPHSDNEKRTKNLQLACASLNGVVLQPGDVLSYNETLGKRTEENGYMAAPAYSGTELVDSLGGGICQVSSTLYLCSLYAELETVDRVNHGFPVAYIPLGLDATVSWGSPDLKIRNNTDYPVKIMAEERDGFVRIWLMGFETRDYTVRIGFTSSSDGYARSYICHYDPATGEQLSREPYQWSSYMGEIDSLYGEIGPDQIYRFGMSRDQEIGAPAPETVEASRRCIAPNAHPEG